MSGPTERCQACRKLVPAVRVCADGVSRCASCRHTWIAKQHAIPLQVAPPSVGEQSRFA